MIILVYVTRHLHKILVFYVNDFRCDWQWLTSCLYTLESRLSKKSFKIYACE